MQRVLFITTINSSFQKWRAAAKKHIEHVYKYLTLKQKWKSSKNHCRHRLQSPRSWICFTILEYTNYSLVIQRVAKNPDVPYGKTFECRCLDVFINTGHNTVRMITSTQAVFYESPPFIAWKIKDGMKNGVMEKSIALGESICDIRAQSIQLSESERGQ